jgi:hypothetical protein
MNSRRLMGLAPEAGTLAYRMGAFASQQKGTLDFREGSTSDISTALALAYVRFGPRVRRAIALRPSVPGNHSFAPFVICDEFDFDLNPTLR